MTELWVKELERYLSFAQEQKMLWLSRLLFFVSMFARDTAWSRVLLHPS